MAEEKSVWLSVLATFLWVIVSAGAFTLLIPFDTLFSVLGIAMQTGDITETVADKYRFVTARQWGWVFFGAAWLGASIWSNSYLEKGATVGKVLARFGIIMAVEAAIWLIAYLASPSILVSMLPW